MCVLENFLKTRTRENHSNADSLRTNVAEKGGKCGRQITSTNNYAACIERKSRMEQKLPLFSVVTTKDFSAVKTTLQNMSGSPSAVEEQM